MQSGAVTNEAVQLGLKGLAPEGKVSFAEFADEVGGKWAAGWYRARVVPGFATRSGSQKPTGDEPSKDGTSRNLWLSLELANSAGDKRNMRYNVNYRVTDFERAEAIRHARRENAGVKGAWDNKDLQRSSLAVGKLGQIEKAFGFSFDRHPEGHLLAGPFVGHAVDVRLSDKEEFNEITGFAPAGTKSK